MKLGFITFSNTNFIKPTRILSEAREFNMFDFILHKTEKDIPEFIEKHISFIQYNKKGYGFYIWKPKIILETLKNMDENDILVYCDAGMKLNTTGVPRFHEYVNILSNPETHMLVFSSNDVHVPQFYVKRDAIMYCFPEFEDQTKYTHYYYAGVMMLKKTEKTIKALEEWLALCENYHFLHPTIKSKYYNEIPGYQGNDCDNGLFNIVIAKHNIHSMIYPDETNVYNPSGEKNPTETDWSSIDKFPFHCRRLVPRT